MQTVKPGKGKTSSEARLAQILRQGDPPVVSTVSNGMVMLDFRTIKEEDEIDLAAALLALDQTIG
jgi:seryl-tRNA(Sec) selenium transferase